MWQLVQFAVVGTCLPSLPVALTPSWQLAHTVAEVNPEWSILVAGSQASVLWQVSHETCVAVWLEGLPLAVLPLWQVVQVPVTTPA